MPGLSGSDLAYRWAIADDEPRGKVRADSTRAGFFLRNAVYVSLNGTRRSGTIQSSLRIDLNTGAEPHRCAFDFKGGGGYVPLAGHSVTIGHGTLANVLFSGRLIKVERHSTRHDERRHVYRCDAAGHVFDLTQLSVLPVGYYVRSLSLSSVVRGLLGVTTPSAASAGFTVGDFVDTGIVAEFSAGVFDTVPVAIERATRSVDAEWYVDHGKVVRAFGSVNTAPGVVPSTITTTGSPIWGVSYQASDLSRAYSAVRVIGRGVPILTDVVPAIHNYAIVESGSLVANNNQAQLTKIVTPSGDKFGALIFDRMYSDVDADTTLKPVDVTNEWTIPISTFLPMSLGCTTLTVVHENISSFQIVKADRWIAASNQHLYVTSVIGIFSATANSMAWAYALPAEGMPGAPMAGGVGSLADVSGVWNIKLPSSVSRDVLPAGTMANVMVTLVNSTAVSEIGSLTGTSGLVWKRFEDDRLSPDACFAVGSAAVALGRPGNWQTLEFQTRDQHFEIGRPVYVSVTSPAESGGPAIAGAFMAHDVSIGDFGRLTETQGPVRTVSAGPVRRPTMWQVLQGD